MKCHEFLKKINITFGIFLRFLRIPSEKKLFYFPSLGKSNLGRIGKPITCNNGVI